MSEYQYYEFQAIDRPLDVQGLAERARRRKLEALAPRETEVWAEVMALIDRKTGPAYDEAVVLLKDLRALAIHQGERERFTARVRKIQADYPTRSALLSRLQKARLV